MSIDRKGFPALVVPRPLCMQRGAQPVTFRLLTFMNSDEDKMKNRLGFLLAFFLLFLCPALSFAGPGGKIASVVAETFWGKILVGVLVVLLLPLIIYLRIKENRAKKRVLYDLETIASYNPDFDWFTIRDRVQDCFYRVHAAWERSDVSQASDWMTDWYWQNQQLVFLDRWEKNGLVNVCEVDIISSIKPIFFTLRNYEGRPGEGSMLAVLIVAVMKDYLERKSDGELVEGSRQKKRVERVWSFVFENGQWLVSNIDEGSNSLAYIEMMKTVPTIKKTLDRHGTPDSARNAMRGSGGRP